MHPLPAIPRLTQVDTAVVGSSSGAVAAALSLKSGGRSVLLVADRSFFGVETAGRLILEAPDIDRSDPLVRRAFPSPGPVFPAAVKHELETALLEAGIPFLFFTRPVGILEGASGNLAGLLLAQRTSLFAVSCATVIDASAHGVCLRLGGIPITGRPGAGRAMQLRAVCSGSLPDWEPGCRPAGTFSAPSKDGPRDFLLADFELPPIRTELPRAAWEHAARAMLADRRIEITAEILTAEEPEMIGGATDALVESVDNLPESAFEPAPGLFAANRLLPLHPDAATRLDRMDSNVALGRRVAAFVLGREAKQTSEPVTGVRTGAAGSGGFRFAPAFLRNRGAPLQLPELNYPELDCADVLVAGGGTGGAGAAIASAREGGRTVVLELQHGLGGVGTLGLIASYWFGNRVGFTEELRRELAALDPTGDSERGNRWNTELKMAVYHRLLAAAGGQAWLGSFAFGVHRTGDRVDGVLVSTPFGCGLVRTGCVIDSTGNADIAAAAGAPCRVIGAAHAAVQGSGLSPRDPGHHYRNSDHTFIDDADPAGVTHAFVNARAKFRDAFDTSPLADTRERRQIEGDLEISPLDILAERTFPDTLVTASSNFDTHGFTIHPVFAVAPPDKKPMQAHVPFRCMLPRGLDGVLVTGLGMSAHRDAIPVIRMQADVQNQGYAAGLAAAESARSGTPLRTLDIRALQGRLVALGILDPAIVGHADSFPPAPATLERAARAHPRSPLELALLFADPARAIPLLRRELADSIGPDRQPGTALVLGFMGCAEAAPILIEQISRMDWDEGWNFRGMGQFGASMSPLDTACIALASTRAPDAIPVLAARIRTLDCEAAFSHCRAAALAGALLPGPAIAAALHELLGLPGMTGHAQLDSLQVVRSANANTTETAARNLALREIYLARGLFCAGDIEGRGRAVLETYTNDLRGVFARHVRAVLHAGPAGAAVEAAG